MNALPRITPVTRLVSGLQSKASWYTARAQTTQICGAMCSQMMVCLALPEVTPSRRYAAKKHGVFALCFLYFIRDDVKHQQTVVEGWKAASTGFYDCMDLIAPYIETLERVRG